MGLLKYLCARRLRLRLAKRRRPCLRRAPSNGANKLARQFGGAEQTPNGPRRRPTARRPRQGQTRAIKLFSVAGRAGASPPSRLSSQVGRRRKGKGRLTIRPRRPRPT